ncbi:UPF0488 protein C8orf33 homolog [Hemiscyllium ocellatum]|uniref:UPF0488 protein C8orf33 homolog n=1 Tax=Hemiscyllium ocellatum TaxID=170820 RepID=UPI002965E129|nr:UPF0488 protein C8orf33 homolog [Hemiscyllium ocellatum]XP_060696662.1 UPF0488 protein C8orf33 homolog [Hemiscyllium ocellatum]XP_060696663.1 UPF0488 protein C8orf33 homolog [Hemiscyllium ocellatum]
MEEAANKNIQVELDCGIQQLQTGVFQLKVSSEQDNVLQSGNSTEQPVPVTRDKKRKEETTLLNHQKVKQVETPQKKKSKVWCNKHMAEAERVGERQNNDRDGREKNSGERQCLSSEEQLWREVDWCIEQLELGLRTQKAKPKQAEQAVRALKTLRSERAPLVKKRQVMRSIFGDYRKKMEEDWQKQFKSMLAATKSASIKPVGTQTKSQIFRKSVSSSKKVVDFSESHSMKSEGSTVQCVHDEDHQSHFRFNFF